MHSSDVLLEVNVWSSSSCWLPFSSFPLGRCHGRTGGNMLPPLRSGASPSHHTFTTMELWAKVNLPSLKLILSQWLEEQLIHSLQDVTKTRNWGCSSVRSLSSRPEALGSNSQTWWLGIEESKSHKTENKWPSRQTNQNQTVSFQLLFLTSLWVVWVFSGFILAQRQPQGWQRCLSS